MNESRPMAPMQSAGRPVEAAALYDELLRNRAELSAAASGTAGDDPAALAAMSGLANSLWRQGLLKVGERGGADAVPQGRGVGFFGEG